MKILRWVATGVLALAGPLAGAQTTVTQWGVSAQTVYADCSVTFSCDLVGFLSGVTPLYPDMLPSGGLNQTFASRIDVQHTHDTFFVDNVNMGIASAQVQLDNTNLSVPVLKAKATGNDFNGWVSGLAFGIQGYQYTGGGATTATLNAALSGTIANPSSSEVTGFSIGVWLLRPDPDVTFPSTPAATLGVLVDSIVKSTIVADSWTPVDVTASGSVSVSDQLSITLNPGDEFYLMAGLTASATGPAHSADAFSTLTMSFDPTVASELVPAGVAPIPEPEIYAMLLCGLGVLGVVARARKEKMRVRRIY